MHIISLAENEVVVNYNPQSDTVTTDETTTSEMLKSIEKNTEHIAQGIDHIFVVGLLLIVWLGIMKVFGKWYFGGV